MHITAKISDLIDGRLSAVEEERAWAHVHECAACRDMVEREGWLKSKLAGLSFADPMPSARFKDTLRADDLAGLMAAGGGAVVHRQRVRGLWALGGSAAGACVVGVLALGYAGNAGVEPRPPVSQLGGSTTQFTPASRDAARSRRTTSTPLSMQLVAVREKMGP